MNSTEKWLIKFKQYRYKIIFTGLILLILIVGCVFVLGGGLDKIRENSQDKNEKVPPAEVAEDVVEDAEGVFRAVLGTEGTVVIDATTSIEDIIEISELQTLSYEYNAICRVYESDGVTPKYYVAYEGDVTLGVDLNDLMISYGDPNNRVITIVIPEVSILSCTVDAGTMDYIFTDPSYNTAQVPIEAHSLCEQDLVNKVNSDTTMFEIARDNTEAAINALTAPLVDQLYPDYTLVIVWEGN